MRGVGFILALFALVGCKTTDDFVGAGPISLSSHTTDRYHAYNRKYATPMLFLVTRDGQYSYSVGCMGELGACDSGARIFDMLDTCTGLARRQCYILNRNGFLVWHGPVLFGDGSVSRPDGTVSAPSSPIGDMSDETICERALDFTSRWPQWSARGASPKYVYEAKTRGLTPSRCTTLQLNTINDVDLCRLIFLRRDGEPEWVGGRLYRHVYWAETHGLTPRSCDRLLTAS